MGEHAQPQHTNNNQLTSLRALSSAVLQGGIAGMLRVAGAGKAYRRTPPGLPRATGPAQAATSAGAHSSPATPMLKRRRRRLPAGSGALALGVASGAAVGPGVDRVTGSAASVAAAAAVAPGAAAAALAAAVALAPAARRRKSGPVCRRPHPMTWRPGLARLTAATAVAGSWGASRRPLYGSSLQPFWRVRPAL